MRHFALLCKVIAASCAIPIFAAHAQAPPANWLLPVPTEITRDKDALAIVQAALTAMNPQGLPAINDQTIQASVTQWNGSPVTGTLTEISVGVLAQSLSVIAGGQTVLHSLRTGDSKTDQLADGSQVTVNDERAFEHIPSLPPLLLQEALSNSGEAVELLSEDPNNPGQSHVRMTLRPSFWQPSMRDSASASFDLFFAKDTSLLTKVTSVKHYDGSLRHYIPAETIFSLYSMDGGRLLPHAIEQREGGRSMNVFSITSFGVNLGILPSALK